MTKNKRIPYYDFFNNIRTNLVLYINYRANNFVVCFVWISRFEEPHMVVVFSLL